MKSRVSISIKHLSEVVDGSFPPEIPENDSAHWLFVINNHVIGRESFVSRVSYDLQSAFVAEICGGLVALQSMLCAW